MAKRDRKDEAGRVASGKYCKGCEDYSSCQYSPPGAPQDSDSELLVKVPAVELRAHTVVPSSHLIHSRPREAEAGGLRTQGLENRKQDQSIKNLASRTGSGVFRQPMCGLIARKY